MRVCSTGIKSFFGVSTPSFQTKSSEIIVSVFGFFSDSLGMLVLSSSKRSKLATIISLSGTRMRIVVTHDVAEFGEREGQLGR